MKKVSTSIDSKLHRWKLKVKIIALTPPGMKYSITKGEYQRTDSLMVCMQRTFHGESRFHLMRYLESLYKDGAQLLLEETCKKEKKVIVDFLRSLKECTERFRTLYSETPIVNSGLSLLVNHIDSITKNANSSE